MRNLSVSTAWDESKLILARDGRLLTTVALALVAFPTAVGALVNPSGNYGLTTPGWLWAVAFFVYLVVLTGQLSMIRLALGPSITVGGAIGHGLRRMPIYVGGLFLVALGVLCLMIVAGLIFSLLGVRVTGATATNMNPIALAVALLFSAIFIYFFVRLVLAAPVVDAEPVGPLAMIRRSWQLTNGHWWRLFGFVAAFFLGSAILMMAIESAAGVVIRLSIGSIEPLSTAALALALVRSLVSAGVTTLFVVMLARLYLQLVDRAEPRETVWG